MPTIPGAELAVPPFASTCKEPGANVRGTHWPFPTPVYAWASEPPNLTAAVTIILTPAHTPSAPGDL